MDYTQDYTVTNVMMTHRNTLKEKITTTTLHTQEKGWTLMNRWEKSQHNMKTGTFINYITTLLHENNHKVVTVKRPDEVIEILFIPTEKENKWVK